MCAIVDNNMRDRFFSNPVDPALRPLWRWIDDGKGVLVVGGHLLNELLGARSAANAIQVWVQAGRAVIVDGGEVDKETERLELAGACLSDDEHVIALARISGARLLCSEDQRLHADFKNSELIAAPGGVVYQSAEHANLLRSNRRWHRSCPFR